MRIASGRRAHPPHQPRARGAGARQRQRRGPASARPTTASSPSSRSAWSSSSSSWCASARSSRAGSRSARRPGRRPNCASASAGNSSGGSAIAMRRPRSLACRARVAPCVLAWRALPPEGDGVLKRFTSVPGRSGSIVSADPSQRPRPRAPRPGPRAVLGGFAADGARLRPGDLRAPRCRRGGHDRPPGAAQRRRRAHGRAAHRRLPPLRGRRRGPRAGAHRRGRRVVLRRRRPQGDRVRSRRGWGSRTARSGSRA